jgi:tRNA-Thr(GGU) m(6)t(6)A37 methyltransferase TsaA
VETFSLAAIGRVRCSRIEPIDDDWGGVEAVISLEAGYDASSLRGLAEFSHLEVVYVFHRVDEATLTTGARRPRDNPAWPEVGIFAQRGKSRPNRLGSSVCELVGVAGTQLRVRGLDAIDGTPVLDIKPYLREFGPRGEIRQPRWADEIMAGYF